MKNLMTVSAALMLTTTAATAGGIDRSGNAYSVLFEDGNYVELSFSKVTPDVSGDYPTIPGTPFVGGSTGNMANDYTSVGLALKYAINDQIDVGLFFNQPYGASAEYSEGTYTGIAADWESNQIAIVLKYQVNDNISVYGGARSVESTAEIALPGATGVYTATTEANRQNGLIAGAAYERKDIALRVALTYEQGMTHDFATTEAVGGATVLESTTDIEIPQAITLDFQTGVAPGTLVFGSIRWSEWSVWEVAPAAYAAANGGARVTGIDNDTTTFRLGVGRQINDQLSVFGRVTYEDSNGDPASRLAPTDGTTSIGLGGSYTMDNTKITAGVEYSMLGDATDATGTAFTDNTAVGFGVSVGFSF